MPDIISDIMNAQFLGIPTIFIIIAFIIAIVVVWKKKLKPKEFKKMDLEKETKTKYKEILNLMGIHVNKRLLYGFERKGWVGSMAEKKDGIRLLSKFHNRLFMKLNLRPTFVLVDGDLLTQNAKEVIINPKSSYDNQFGTITFSKNAREALDDEAYKITHEQSLNELINWLPLQTYLSVQHAQGSEALDHLAEIEKTKRQESINEMTGKNKK